MTLLDYLTEVAQRAEKELSQSLNNNETLKGHLTRSFNIFHKDFNGRYNWPWREKRFTLQTISNYKDGTLAVTNGSRTVTGSSTAFTSAMVGRVLKLDRDTEAYIVKAFVSTSELVLEQPYIGASGSGLAYLIWNKFYDLPVDVPYANELTLGDYPFESKRIPKSNSGISFERGWAAGYPSAWDWAGINRVTSSYTTGTVTVAENSKAVTGSGTSWLGNVFPGDDFIISGTTYNIESVDSDTELTLVQNVYPAVAAGSNYTARRKNRSRIMFNNTPDPVRNIEIVYFKRTYDYRSDIDETEIWPGFEHILTDVLYGYLLEKLTSEKSLSWLTVYNSEIESAWGRLQNDPSIEQALRMRRSIPSGYRSTLYA